jgi:N-acetylglucosamine kinase-like BadF-type ATPase
MILIADSGSTKTQWVLLDNGKKLVDITTKGFNPYYYSKTELEKALFDELHIFINPDVVEEIYFYGAGCSTVNNCLLVKNALSSLFRKARIYAGHDLEGAAVSLLQESEGIACILGTGSNSCLWNGKKVIYNVPSLGYLLGDEGSGTYIGKLILQNILYGNADKKLTEIFYNKYQLDFESTLHKIYGEPNPNKFMSSLSIFVNENINYPECRNAVHKSFSDYISTQISKYPDFNKTNVSFTGSVAYHFQDILKEVLKENNITLGIILKAPMDGLIKYHSKK